MNTLLHFFGFTFMAIFPITNPIGMAPIFLSLTKEHLPQDRRKMAKRVAINSFYVYLIALLLGSWILSFFSLSIPIIKIAGGIILFFAAFNMLNSKPKMSNQERRETLGEARDITFFPLTMPITTGAGSLAIAMAIGTDIISGNKFNLLILAKISGASFGIAALALTIFVCYYLSSGFS